MRVIQDILDLDRARTIEDVDEAYARALDDVNAMHMAKLKEIERAITRRLGVESMAARSGPTTTGPDFDERPKTPRHPTMDEPQA